MAIDYPPPPPSSDFPTKETQTNQESQQREPARNDAPEEVSYKTKKILFRGETKIIVLQDMNGPCSLIAICNVLILTGEIHLIPTTSEEVTQEALFSHLTSLLLNSKKKNDETNVDEAMKHLRSLASGLYVHLNFKGIYDFEHTTELAPFHALNIPLCHGWLVDFEDPKIAAAFKGITTYDKLVELKEQTDGLTQEEGQVIQQFFNDRATQLTWHGLSCLKRDLKEGELCVLFRNSHLYTMLKHDNELYTLVTDQGFEQQVVWESLNQVNGDSEFFSCHFESYKDLIALSPSSSRSSFMNLPVILPLKKRLRRAEPEPELTLELPFSHYRDPCLYGDRCALLGCYLPRSDHRGYCSVDHRKLAASFSRQTRPHHCFGGFSDLTDLEATCLVVLFHLESGLDVGVPFLHVQEIFNTAPWMQDVFQTSITPCAWIFFHLPPKIYKTFPNGNIKWKAQPVRMLKLKGSLEEVKLTAFKLQNSKLPWNLYLFQYKEDSSLYCLTLGGSNERPLTRKPKSILFKS